jgi:proteasome lid subunit RPN8/RPN11
VRIDAVPSARNIAPQHRPDRYEVDPLDHLQALALAAARGLDIVGAWHTHPGVAPEPSERDRALAWEDWCYLIVGREAGSVVIRAWRIIGTATVEDTIGP